jgi:hypothetical protein
MPMQLPMPMPNRLAEKNHLKRVHQAMEQQFKEMGMTSVVFISYIQADGKLVIDV